MAAEKVGRAPQPSPIQGADSAGPLLRRPMIDIHQHEHDTSPRTQHVMMHVARSRAPGVCRPLAQALRPSLVAAAGAAAAAAVAGARVTTRPATSLSAIHRGLRRSERAEFGARRLDGDISAGRRPGAGDDGRTRKALEGAASPRQQQKLRKKLRLKAADEETETSGRQTRRKRFLDPDSDFGKRSLVYQIKHGALRGVAASLKRPEAIRTAPPRTEYRPRPPAPWRAERETRGSAAPKGHWSPGRAEDAGPRGRGMTATTTRNGRTAPRDHDWPGKAEAKERRGGMVSTTTSGTAAPKDHDWPDRVEAKERKGGMMSTTIKYTTAASQFLYGKSAVKAALEEGRRKLYKLYVYGGDKGRESRDDAVILRLAEDQGVRVEIVGKGEQRLMDKMSMGRPHNGFVLETSPLPQPPVRSLGRVEEAPGRRGFGVRLERQTREEEAVNGSETFVRRRSGAATGKPLVLLLN